MAESHDRTELHSPTEETPGVKRTPYAVLAAAGVGVATACAALASFIVTSGPEAQPPHDQSPQVVTQVNGKTTTLPPSSEQATDTPATSISGSTQPGATTTTTKQSGQPQPPHNPGNPGQPPPNNPGNPGPPPGPGTPPPHEPPTSTTFTPPTQGPSSPPSNPPTSTSSNPPPPPGH
jgi:hypothetical protein